MGYTNLPVQQADKLLKYKDVVILDMRDEQSFMSDHIKGAIPASETNIQDLIRSGKRDIPVIIYCYHGNSSRDLSGFLSALKLTQVYNLEGGWEAWSRYQSSAGTTATDHLDNWMIKHGFDPDNLNSRVENGMSAAMIAILEGQTDILKALIDNNIDLNLVNDDENNALWFACLKEDQDSIQTLLKSGINIDNHNVNGATALIYAASAGKFEIVKFLVQAGADTKKSTLDGFTALDSATTYPILKLLKPLTIAA